MACSRIREAISARLDHEDPGLDQLTVDAHLAACSSCRRWAVQAEDLHRMVRVQAADAVPDLTEAILSAHRAAPSGDDAIAAKSGVGRQRRPSEARSRWAEPISTVRWALFVVGLTQLVLALPAVVLGEASGASIHAARELGSFDVALAVGLLVAAWQPARAWGLLPVAGALGLVLGGTALLDVVDGSASTVGEAHHLLDLAGVALLALVARDARSVDSAPRSSRRWSAA